MKKALIAISLFLMSLFTGAQEYEFPAYNNKSFTAQEKPFADLSQKIWDLMAAKDADALKEIFHPDCEFVHMGGYWGTEQELQTIRSGMIWYKHAEVYGEDVKVVDNSTVAVYSTIVLDAQLGPQTTSHPFFVTQTFKKEKGTWKLVNFVFTTRVMGPGTDHGPHMGMTLNINDFKWTREPAGCVIKDGTVEVTTAPHTDLWQRTYYHFRNDNAPVFQMETEEKFFSFIVKTDFTESHHRFDQCGVVMYLDSENWLKGSVEYENEQFQHLGSVVTNEGYSDWATTAIPANVKTMWYRLSRREDDYCIECSTDGVNFSQMRVCHMDKGAGKIRFGIYACSPEDSSFKAVFSDLQLTECAWKAHDGQQPDKN